MGKTLCQLEGSYRALVLPNFGYCNEVYDGLSNQLSSKLQKLQSPCDKIRVILSANYDSSASVLREKLCWETLAVITKSRKLLM